MADSSRLEDLRRRVEKDPASIAFAQLAEEYRRAGLLEQSVEVCQAGLKIHPGYLSARVTLGRALLELSQLPDAKRELDEVLRSAPENLAAMRGLAEIHQREGNLPEALEQYRAALALARNDPDLERTVEELARQVAPKPRPQPANGLSFEQIHQELLVHAPTPAAAAAPVVVSPDFGGDVRLTEDANVPAAEVSASASAVANTGTADDHALEFVAAGVATSIATAETAPQYNAASSPADDRALRTIAALTQWLHALNVPRIDSRP